MLIPSSTGHQTNLFGTDLLQQLDPSDPLLGLAQVIPWPELDQAFARHYTQGFSSFGLDGAVQRLRIIDWHVTS